MVEVYLGAWRYYVTGLYLCLSLIWNLVESTGIIRQDSLSKQSSIPAFKSLRKRRRIRAAPTLISAGPEDANGTCSIVFSIINPGSRSFGRSEIDDVADNVTCEAMCRNDSSCVAYQIDKRPGNPFCWHQRNQSDLNNLIKIDLVDEYVKESNCTTSSSPSTVLPSEESSTQVTQSSLESKEHETTSAPISAISLSEESSTQVSESSLELKEHETTSAPISVSPLSLESKEHETTSAPISANLPAQKVTSTEETHSSTKSKKHNATSASNSTYPDDASAAASNVSHLEEASEDLSSDEEYLPMKAAFYHKHHNPNHTTSPNWNGTTSEAVVASKLTTEIMIAIIVGVAIIVAIVCGVLVYMLMSKKKKPDEQAASEKQRLLDTKAYDHAAAKKQTTVEINLKDHRTDDKTKSGNQTKQLAAGAPAAPTAGKTPKVSKSAPDVSAQKTAKPTHAKPTHAAPTPIKTTTPV